MPKREKFPPPPDDEPKYLVVVHPYPPNTNLEIVADRRAVALWLACCTGKKDLLAMFQKPTSPGMVIIEVDCEFKRFADLLGKHTWSNMLINPENEEKDKSSEVFYCNLKTGRDVENNGWKRIWVEEHWFHGWRPDNTRIKYPYPKTTYCDVPPEPKTGEPLCHPLMQNGVPPKPIVAQTERLAPTGNGNTLPQLEIGQLILRDREAPYTSATMSAPKGRGTDSVLSTSSNSRHARSPPPPPAGFVVVSPMGENPHIKQDSRKPKVPLTGPFLSSAVGSSALSTASAPVVPPGLPPLPPPPPAPWALTRLPGPPRPMNPPPPPRQPSPDPPPPRAPVSSPRQPPDLPPTQSHSPPPGPSPPSGPPPPPPSIQSPPVLGLTQPVPQVGKYEHFDWSDDVELEEDEDDSPIGPDHSEGEKTGYSTLPVDGAPRAALVSGAISCDCQDDEAPAQIDSDGAKRQEACMMRKGQREKVLKNSSKKSALDADCNASRNQSLHLMNGSDSERGRRESSSSSNDNSNSDFGNNGAEDSSSYTQGECEDTTSPDTPLSPPLDEKRGRGRDRGSSHRGANAPAAARTTKNNDTVSRGKGAASSVHPPNVSANDTVRICKPIPREAILAQGGFPSFGDEEWGDPIAAFQNKFAAEKAEKAAAKAEKKKQKEMERASEGRESRGRRRNRGGSDENSAAVESATDSDTSGSGATGTSSAASGASGGASRRRLPVQLTVEAVERPQDTPERWADPDVVW